MKGWIQGRADESVLTELGIEQARRCGTVLGAVQFDQVFSSPLNRARHTCTLITPIPPTLLATLQEIDLPRWEGMTAQEVAQRFPQEHQIYRLNPAEFEIAGRYPVVELWAEARAAWEVILASPGHCVLVVAHNAINQALISTALGLGPMGYRALGQNNGGISVLNFDDQGQVQLESLNQTAHLTETPNFTPKPGVTRLLLIRHGETDWNRTGRFQGQLDIPLNATGVDQAQKTVALLKDLAFTQVFVSPLQRAYTTAQALLAHQPHLALTILDDLQEIAHGTWEGKYHPEVEAEYPGLLAVWNQQPETVQMPAGESLQEIWARSAQAWAAILQQVNGLTLVAAHDAINKALLCQVLGLGPEAFWRFKQGNGAVSVIDYPDGITGRGVLQSLNYTAHLTGNIFDCTAAGAL